MTTTFAPPQPITGPLPNTPEWHAFRATGIGASEAAAACGLSPYETPLHIYGRKTGMLPPVEENVAMRLGKKLEPVIVSEFCHVTGHTVKQAPVPTMKHPEFPFIIASPDAILDVGEPLEAKSTSWQIAKQLGEEGTDFVPESWLCQTQQQMAVLGTQVCHLGALVDGRTLRVFRIEFNDRLWELMVKAERELWERIQDRRPPEPNWEHAQTLELMRELYGLAEGKTIVLGDGPAGLWLRQKELGERVSELEKERDGLRAMLLHEMGDAAIATFPGFDFEVTRSTVNRKAYTVEATSYVQLRGRKPPKGKKR